MTRELPKRIPASRGRELNTNCFFSNFSGTSGISWQNPAKMFDFPGFEGHTELFGPHPFTWKNPTFYTEPMDAEGLGRRLLLTPFGDPPKVPEKQTVGTVTASHKMLSLQALSSSLNAGTAKRGSLDQGKAFGWPPAVCPPKWPRPFARCRPTPPENIRMYSHRVNSPKNLAKYSGNTSSKIFSVFARVRIQAPHASAQKSNSPRNFSCMYWFCAGG